MSRWIVDHITRRGAYTEAALRRGDTWQLTATEFNQLRDELIEIRELQRKVAEIHQEHEGRCVECVEWCECENRDQCEHGNVSWPCSTARAMGAP